MSQWKKWFRRGLAHSVAAAAGGTLFIPFVPSCETLLTVINPCGSVLGFCDPTDIDLLFADIPDFDLDPSCAIPFGGLNGTGDQFCSNVPPFRFTPGSRP